MSVMHGWLMLHTGLHAFDLTDRRVNSHVHLNAHSKLVLPALRGCTVAVSGGKKFGEERADVCVNSNCGQLYAGSYGLWYNMKHMKIPHKRPT